jgi:hypothetical protein
MPTTKAPKVCSLSSKNLMMLSRIRKYSVLFGNEWFFCLLLIYIGSNIIKVNKYLVFELESSS